MMRTDCIRPRLRIPFLIAGVLSVGYLAMISLGQNRVTFRGDSKDRFQSTTVDIYSWYAVQTTFCGKNVTGYGHMFFKLKSANYDPISDTFSVTCNEWLFFNRPSRYWFLGGYAPQRYSKSLVFNRKFENGMSTLTDNSTTVVVYREYPHNFFHAMTQWYNIYILSILHGFEMKSVNILLLDRGPATHLDAQWRLLFRTVRKAGELAGPLFLHEAIFNIAGHESLMYYFSLPSLPFIESFSRFFLDNFGLKTKIKYDCSNLTITLVVRHDYYMHPGVSTEKRIAERKYKNEEELITSLQRKFPGHSLRILAAEDMSLPEQLKLTSQTDILIGMHGCVLTHTLFLPHHAMVLELYPSFWKIQGFFSAISRWRNIKYYMWQNKDQNNEFPNHYTYIPTDVLDELFEKSQQHFACQSNRFEKT